jgi:hypothetical protein
MMSEPVNTVARCPDDCQYSDPDGAGGYHCVGGKHDGRNVSAGVCRACLGIPTNRMMPRTQPTSPWTEFEAAVRLRGSDRLKAELDRVNDRRRGLCGCGQRAILEQRFIEQHRNEVGYRG